MMTDLPASTRIARATALFLVLVLFTVGSLPAAGQAFPGPMHWVAHFSAYALIAFVFALGWPQRSAVTIVILVAVIGVLQETSEIITHSHGFETADAVVDAFGALIGVAIHRLMLMIFFGRSDPR